MRVFLSIVFCAVMMPLRVSLQFKCSDDRLPAGRLGLQTLLGGFSLPLETVKKGKKLYLLLGMRKRPMRLTIQRSKHAMPMKRLFPKLTEYLRRALKRSLAVSADVQLGLSSAASTALACAALTAALQSQPRLTAHIAPDYRRQGIRLQFACIASFRLGKLLLTAALWGTALALRRIEEVRANGSLQGQANRRCDADGA